MSAQSGKTNLHEKQQAFVNTSVDKAAYIGGRRSGKTTALMAVAAKWANDDYRVLFGAPSQKMWKEAFDDIRGMLNKPLRTNKQGKIKLQSGGVITFTSFSSRGVSYSPDVLVIDEFNHLRDTKMSYIPHFDTLNKVYVAGTPATFDVPFIDCSWDVTLAPTNINPAIKQTNLEQWKKSLSESQRRREMLQPIIMGEHGLFPVHTGAGTIYKCLFCDFEQRLPNRVTGTHHKYAIGKALSQGCC